MADEDVGVSGLAGRYATALFDLAEQDGALDAVAADLASVRAMLDQSADLRRLMRSPVIARDDQGRGVAAVLDAAGAATLTASNRSEAPRMTRRFRRLTVFFYSCLADWLCCLSLSARTLAWFA